MAHLAVIGCVSIDTIRVPNKVVTNVFGGSAGYAALAASFFTKVALVSTIGSNFPPELLKMLQNHNINTEGLLQKEGKTAHFDIEYDEELFEAVYHKADLNVLEEPIKIPNFIRQADYVYISANHPKLQLEIIEQLGKRQTVATDTHSMWIEQERSAVIDVLQVIDILFINNVEACKLAGYQTLKSSAKKIMELGNLQQLIIKKGQHGAILFTDKKMYPAIAYETYNMPIVDPTGCGDTVAGGYMGVLASNQDYLEPLNDIHLKALIFGLVVASFNIMDFSVNKLLSITKEDIWRRYDRFRDMIGL